MPVNYTKPSASEMRLTLNAFGNLPMSKVMKMRERATKMVLMDYATQLIDRGVPHTEVTAMIEKPINLAIEKGLCSMNIIQSITKFINKKYTTTDPLLKLHYAIMMETLEELGGSGTTDVSVLPEEIQEASECGADCFGQTTPSLESLHADMGNDPHKRLVSLVGGSLATQIIQELSVDNTLDMDYVKSR